MGILPKIFGRSTFSWEGDAVQVDRPVASGLEFSLSRINVPFYNDKAFKYLFKNENKLL